MYIAFVSDPTLFIVHRHLKNTHGPDFKFQDVVKTGLEEAKKVTVEPVPPTSAQPPLPPTPTPPEVKAAASVLNGSAGDKIEFGRLRDDQVKRSDFKDSKEYSDVLNKVITLCMFTYMKIMR